MTGSVSSRRLLEPAPAVPVQLFYTVPGTNLTWPSDNGAGKDVRARFGKYVAQSNEDNRRTRIIVKMVQQDWKQKVTIERHVAQTYL